MLVEVVEVVEVLAEFSSLQAAAIGAGRAVLVCFVEICKLHLALARRAMPGLHRGTLVYTLAKLF